MSALLIQAHSDDACLFAAFICCREKPLVVSIFGDQTAQTDVLAEERRVEDKRALPILGVEPRMIWHWPYADAEPDWGGIEDDLRVLAQTPEPGRGHLRMAEYGVFDKVFAPWPEPKGGNPHHDRIGELARDIFGDRVRFYTTYRVGGPRTVGTPSDPEPWMIPLKLRALACYESQILRGPRRFFMHSLEEWTMP